MELRHIKYFLTLANELHFGKAAEKLFISQPPLSRLIKSLEDELDVPLFERTNKKVALTKYGQYMKTEATKMFAQIDAMKNHLKLMKNTASNPIRIGYVASVMYYFLPKVLDDLKNRFPQSVTVLIELNDTEQFKAMKTNEIEIGFSRGAEKDKELVFEHIFDEPYSLICSKKHSLAKSKHVEIIDFTNDPFISFTSTCSLMKGINSIFNKNGILPNVVHQTSQINTLLRLVESNVGYAIVPSTVIQGFDLKIKDFELSAYDERSPIYVVYKKAELSEILQQFIKIIKEKKSVLLD
jgi:DNA-binding transcriptional LysR family regulator